jgi:hypothetical protein
VIEVILPVLDEAESIPHALEAIPPGFAPLVVDNGSSDRAGGPSKVTGTIRGSWRATRDMAAQLR